MSKEDISSIRHDYGKFSLDEKSIKKNPFEQFEIWFNDSLKGDFTDPNAFALSTVNNEGKPSSRILLLKGYDSNGFVFYSNYESRKGQEIEQNPYGAMLFFWDKFERQIRIEGKIEKLGPEESNQYFQSRPYTSRLGAWASEQSKVLKSRFTLMRKVAMLMLKYPTSVPLPPHWGGYRLIPEQFEFWQGRPSRLHDRFRYKLLPDGNWQIDRLYP
ncbi:MAG TPA: pyridoxamine 5'-phosphate oxidase [Candidatus Kapabacteria bacterium]|jgi:pyridoxamine 5'-phosphate oxidase|nr:pyridoxamine 5'-phosphate oxidase [Candidatus Kapabacteria bacterium]HPU22941.1 pyridoxamine 5'-phosphate oxidase [Candidatus Kapabacteria bacterium]